MEFIYLVIFFFQKEMFPDIDEDRIHKIFSDLQKINEDGILERVIESILTTQVKR